MAVRAKAEITLSHMIDVIGNFRYYLLQSSTLSAPTKPTIFPPPEEWDDAEPSYTSGSTNSLYIVDCTTYSNGTFYYSPVSLSTSYEAAKAAYNKAVAAGEAAKEADEKIESESASIREEILNQSSYLLETSESITLGILEGYTKTSDLETYKKEIENKFTTSSEGFSFEFEQLSKKLTELGSEVSDQKQYIRLVNGEIQIGKSDSPVTSVYTNNALEFRYNDVTVARFTNDCLEVRNIAVDNQVSFFDQWAIRKGAYIAGKGYNLNDVWIGG